MPYAKKINLKYIYKASQCTDINDCILSIKDIQSQMMDLRATGYFPDRSAYIRLNSLWKKLKALEKKRIEKQWKKDKKH